MPDRIQVLYLHGFASSPQSSKATYLAGRFAERGIPVQIPDLNLPDFSTLTVSRMLDQANDALDRMSASPVVVVGSSLGGFVAVNLAAERPDRVASLILLAPALDIGSSTVPSTGKEMRRIGDVEPEVWKRAGTVDVFHYGYGRTMPIHYELYADASRYDAMQADLRMPIVVFQGTRDGAVDPATVEAWSRRRPNVELHLLDDDHQLSGSLDYIWERIRTFLKIG